jgi:hypothetical protein
MDESFHLDESQKNFLKKTLDGWNIPIMDENTSKWMKK